MKSLTDHGKMVMFNLGNMALGVCMVADGLVRVLSFGLMDSTFALNFAFWRLQRRFNLHKTARD